MERQTSISDERPPATIMSADSDGQGINYPTWGSVGFLSLRKKDVLMLLVPPGISRFDLIRYRPALVEINGRFYAVRWKFSRSLVQEVR